MPNYLSDKAFVAMTTSSLSLQQNISWTLIGNLTYAACQWGIIVVLTKLASPEVVGQFTLGLAISTPIIVFANLQLRAIQSTDVQKKFLFGDYLRLRLITTFLAILVLTVCTMFLGYKQEIALTIIVLGIARAIESISDIFYGSLQQYERMDIIARSMIFKGILSLLALGCTIYLTNNIILASLGLAFSWLLVLIVCDIPGIKNIQHRNHSYKYITSNLLVLAKRALPIGITMLLISLNLSIPRYFIERYLGQWDLGIFSAIAYLQMVGTTVIAAVGQSASPRLARYYSQGERQKFQVLLAKLLSIAGVVGTAGVLIAIGAGRDILTILYQPEYAEYVPIFVGIMISSGIAYCTSFLGYAMTAAQYFNSQFPVFLTATVVTTLTSAYFIPQQGLQGAVLVGIISGITQLTGSLLVVWHSLKNIERTSYIPDSQ
jgi:O-antigen/teichoic acid export membrane protein